MKKKNFLQISLILLTLIFSLILFNQILKKEKKIVLKVENQKKEAEDNMIEGIKYFSKDMKGNTYLIESKKGAINKEDPDIIYLVDVEAEIKFDRGQLIKVTSNKAVYNINNYDTEFTDDVKLSYKDNKISCKNIVVKFSENYAILSGNLIYNNLLTSLFADQMKVDLITRTTKTSMINNHEKVKIVYKNNGTN
tara:strand:+ start:1129 stop:1710 length:582 start_codon:yes stop_codon:yes gene_type:complete